MRLLILLPALMLAACQSYQPLPLDDAAHRDEWQARDPAADGVVALARRLGVAGYMSGDGVSLREAEAIALFYNPGLRVARSEAGIELATAENSGYWADPEFSLGLEWILASVSRPWVIGVGLRFTLPLSGRPGVERDLAWARHGNALANVLTAEWQTVTDLRRTWLAALRSLEQAGLTAGYTAELEALLEIARRLEAGGVISRLDRRMLEHELALQRVEWRRAAQELEQAKARLLELMGLRPAAPLAFELAIEPAAVPAEREELLRARHPQVEARRRAYDVAEQELRLEIRKQYPDLSIGPSYELEGGQSKIGLGFGIPIPIINLNREGIARAGAERVAARAAYEAELESALHALALAEMRRRHAAEYRALVEAVAELAERHVEDAAALARLGEFDVLRQLEALSRRHETRIRALLARFEELAAAYDVLALLGPDYAMTVQENK